MFRQEAETAQKHVQDYVEQKHKKEAELYVKARSVSHVLLNAYSSVQLAFVCAAVCSCSQREKSKSH